MRTNRAIEAAFRQMRLYPDPRSLFPTEFRGANLCIDSDIVAW